MKVVMLEGLALSQETLQSYVKPIEDAGHTFVNAIDMPNKKEAAQGADALIIANSPLSVDVVDASDALKLIAVGFTGTDHVPMEHCRARGIQVTNAAGYCTNSVCELTYGLIFSCLRNIPACDAATRAGKTKAGLVGNELLGKTVGIVGVGAIGMQVATVAKAFGCKVLGYSRTQREEAQALGVEYVSLDELMAQADIITLHTPLTNETRSLINAERIAMMKKSAILINMARGPVVDSDALAIALREGRIAGAGIDVFEIEPPLDTEHVLLHTPNTVVTPHAAFATQESMLRRADIVFSTVYSFLGIEK